jgi:hypothetical protein
MDAMSGSKMSIRVSLVRTFQHGLATPSFACGDLAHRLDHIRPGG